MKINRFFTETLGLKLRNPRWSWGAVASQTNRVFLRIWEDQIRQDGSGQKVQIYWKNPRNKSPGYAERLEQIGLIRQGASGLGILTKAVDPNARGPRQIASFREEVLFELGEFSEDDDGFYAQLLPPIPTNRVIATRAISRSSIPSKEELSKYEKAVTEGTVGTITGKVRRRCEELRRRAREYYRDADGRLCCEVCGWHKPDHPISGDIVELHHLRPLAHLPMEGVQQLLEKAIKSLVPLCPCCHRVAHARHGNIRSPFSVDELKVMISRRDGP